MGNTLKSTGDSCLKRSVWLRVVFFSRFGSQTILEDFEYNKTAVIPMCGRAGHLMCFHIFCLCPLKLYFAGFLSIYVYEFRGKADPIQPQTK